MQSAVNFYAATVVVASLLLPLCFCWICWLICVLIGHLSDGRGVWRNEFLVDAQQLFAPREYGGEWVARVESFKRELKTRFK